MPLTIQLEPSAQQTAFNLKRWAELLADPELARLPHRIETDRHGHILMSPPPAPKHGNFQSEVAHLLRSLLSPGRVITDVIRQLRIFCAIGLNERLCSRERFLCISEAGKMLVNEGVYVAERRSSCADCFLDLFDGIFRR